MTGIFLTFILALTIQSCYPCGFVTDLQNETIQVDESASPRKSTPVTIQVSPDVKRIDFSSGSEDNTKYFDFVLDRTTSLVHLLPKESLTNFFDVSDSDTVEVMAPKLKCSGGAEFISSYPIRVTVMDVNDKPPEFVGPIETKVFNVELPYRGAPVNWNQVLKVTDGDFKEENTQLQFYAEPQGLVKITPDPPVKVMSNGRLMYYEVYFSLEQTWETPGLYPVTIMASDGVHFDSLTVELNITKGPDMQQPIITEDKSYHSTRLNNTVGETIAAATIVDDMGATEDLYIKVTGKYGRKFGVVVNETAVSVQLKRAFTPEQLEEVDYLVRVTLLATDATGNSASLPLAIQFQRDSACTTNQPADMSDENEISKSARNLEQDLDMAGTEAIHVTITTDDNDSVTSIGANLTGDIKNKFEVAMQPDGTVHLKLKDEFLDHSMELLDNEWMIRLTLTITDDKNNLTPRQQKELGMQGRKAIKMLPDGEMKVQDEDGGTTTEMTTEGTTTEMATDGTTTEMATDGTTTQMATDGTTTEFATDGTTTQMATDGTTTEFATDGTTTQMATDGTTTETSTEGTSTEMPTTTSITLSEDNYSAENEVPEESRIESRIYQPPTPVDQQRTQTSSGQQRSGGRNPGNQRYQGQSSYGQQFPPQSQYGQGQRGGQIQFGQNQAQSQYGQQQQQYQNTGGQQQQGNQEHICSGEGYFPDPNSCTKFHRCVYNIRSGRYTDYRMECGPGVDLWCPSTLSCSFSYQCPDKCTASNSDDTEQYDQ